MTAIEGSFSTRRVGSRRRLPAGLEQAIRRPEQLVFALPVSVGFVAMLVSVLTLLTNETDVIIGLLLFLIAVALGVSAAVRRVRTGQLDRSVVVLAVVSVAAAVVAFILPTWAYGANINGVVHRTFVTGPLLLVIGTAATSLAIGRLFRTTPSGQDMALVPVLTVAILIGVIGYVLVIGRVLVSGLEDFNVSLLITPWQQIANQNGYIYTVGFLNNILGTFLLIAMALLFAIFPGVGAAVFMNEYPGRLAGIMRFCITMLRAIALFILGVAAFGAVRASQNVDSSSFLSQLIRGGYSDASGVSAERGSFILAAVFLALLVIPVIARLTEEGLRSVPREIREGSVALGGTDGYNLRRVLLPWAAPNILTALIIAGAEVAGGLAAIMFIAVPGQNGIGPTSGVTDLDFAIFATKYGPRVYVNSMHDYGNVAAMLLLVLTFVLTLIAMAFRRRFAARYRGTLTAQ
jgi:ABC-type phosphate transport system permease subunit